MKRIKKRPFALVVSLCLVLGLLSPTALAADPGSHLYVGGVELIGSADQPAYATTDSSGKVNPEGDPDHYNIKWDGAMLTLNGANVTGGYSYIDYYGDPSSAAIYCDGDMQILLVGENSVTGFPTDSEFNNGIAAKGDLTISGSGSLKATGGYDGIASQNGDLTILSGDIMAEGGSGGISTYEGNLTISGGEVTATGNGSYYDVSSEVNVSYGFYIDGDCTISGGKVTITAQADFPYITRAYGMYIFGENGLTISGGEVAVAATGENRQGFGIDAFEGAVIRGGTVTATGGFAGIFTQSASKGDIIIEGGAVTATAVGEDGYGIYSRTNIIIQDGTVTATAMEEGGYGVYVKYGDVAIQGGEVNAAGEAAGMSSEEGDLAVNPQGGRQITVTVGSDADSAAAIGGSPFEEEAVITSTLDGVKYFRKLPCRLRKQFLLPDNKCVSAGRTFQMDVSGMPDWPSGSEQARLTASASQLLP